MGKRLFAILWWFGLAALAMGQGEGGGQGGGGQNGAPNMKIVITGSDHFVSDIQFNATVRNIKAPPPNVGEYVATFTASLTLPDGAPSGWTLLGVA